MMILVTNEDRIEAPCIRFLAEATKRVDKVLDVSPDRQQNGVGTVISFHHGLRMTEAVSLSRHGPPSSNPARDAMDPVHTQVILTINDGHATHSRERQGEML